jgi:hypothetical protein
MSCSIKMGKTKDERGKTGFDFSPAFQYVLWGAVERWSMIFSKNNLKVFSIPR